MSFKVFDRVKETSTTSGSGAVTLAGAVNGFQAFSGVYSDGDTTHYVIVNGGQWEAGLGTYSANALSRDVVFESSNNGNKINLLNTSTIFVSYPAARSVLAESSSLSHSGIPYINASGHVATNTGITYNYNSYDITLGGNLTSNTGLFNVLDLTPLDNGDQPSYQEGVMFYDAENKTVTLFNDVSGVSLQIGQENHIRVRNQSGSGINDGQAVYIDGSQGTHPTIQLAVASGYSVSHCIGLATHNIENNSFGYITTQGLVRGIDTSNFNDGDEIFLSPTVPGGITGVSPLAPYYQQELGYVVRSHSSNGSIFVYPQHSRFGGNDVKVDTARNSGIPFFSTINGGAGLTSTDSEFVYDSGNQRLGINQSSPDATIHIVTSKAAAPAAIFEAIAGQSSNLTEWHDFNGDAVAYVTKSGDAYFNNVQVTGALTYINTDILTVQDKNIELASTSGSPLGDDTVVDGGGITLLSSDGNKTITWNNGLNSWNFNQNIDIDNGYSLTINDYTLPAADSTENYIIKTNGSGTLSFVDANTLVSPATGGAVGLRNYVQQTGNYAIPATGYGVFISASGDCLITLPTVILGRTVNIIRTDSEAHTVTVTGVAGELIQGNASSILNTGGSVDLVSDGTNWYIK